MTIIGSLFFSYVVYPSIIALTKNGNPILFSDWAAIIKAVECHNLGYDVYLENPCDYWGRQMVYGNILLYFPFIEEFKLFYYAILPLSISFIFIFIIVSFFDYKNKIEYLKVALLILNYPVFLAIERANFDILIFILFFLLAISNKLFINKIIVCLSALMKFYPLTSLSVFLFDKKIKKSFLNILFCVSIISLILFFQREDLIKIIDLRNQFSGSGIFAFSLNETLINLFYFFDQQRFYHEIPSFIESSPLPANIDHTITSNIEAHYYGKITYVNLGLNNIYLYYLSFFILLLTIIFIIYKSYKRVELISKYNYYKKFSMRYYEDKMFIICSITIVCCYLVFSNIAYREIFFIGLVPFLIKQINNNTNKEYFNFFLNFILAKLFLSTVFTIMYTENLFPDYSVILLLSKCILDLALIVIVAINISSIFYSFYVKNHLKITKDVNL